MIDYYISNKSGVHRTRRASRQNYFDVNLISYQCMGDEGISCDLSIFYILY